LIEQVGQRYGLDAVPYGEVGLKELRARPDYAVDIGRSRVGYIELKRPGRGIPPDWRPDKHESEQWEKLCALPNVIYSDGYSWGVFSYGKLREPIVCIWEPGDSGLSAEATEKLLLLVRKFLTAKPDPPRSLAELIAVIARLCRLLKDDVAAILGSASHPANEDLRLLAGDLRQRLFPDLDDQGFADAYAQSITFALLLAQVNGIAIDKIPLHEIGLQVAKKHSIIGRLFSALTVGDATRSPDGRRGPAAPGELHRRPGIRGHQGVPPPHLRRRLDHRPFARRQQGRQPEQGLRLEGHAPSVHRCLRAVAPTGP
jgi:hypothetical protein